jgi:hypothetical protein
VTAIAACIGNINKGHARPRSTAPRQNSSSPLITSNLHSSTTLLRGKSLTVYLKPTPCDPSTYMQKCCIGHYVNHVI